MRERAHRRGHDTIRWRAPERTREQARTYANARTHALTTAPRALRVRDTRAQLHTTRPPWGSRPPRDEPAAG